LRHWRTLVTPRLKTRRRVQTPCGQQLKQVHEKPRILNSRGSANQRQAGLLTQGFFSSGLPDFHLTPAGAGKMNFSDRTF